MTGMAHISIGICISLIMRTDNVGSAMIIAGSILPDAIDRIIVDYKVRKRGDNLQQELRQAYWADIHRTISHWWIIPLFLMIVSYNYLVGHYIINKIIFYTSLGMMLHITADALNPRGVPLFNPLQQDLSFKMLKYGSRSEKVVIIVSLICSLFLYLNNMGI